MYPYTTRGYAGGPDDYPPAGPEPVSRYTGRTPSPTPSEVEALTSSFLNIKRYMNWRFWARKDWIVWYIVIAIVLVLTVLITVFDKQIVNWLTPAGRWMKSIPFGWCIPIAVLFIISFPPLFGHEIVAILVGVIWGLGLGFAIVAAGTFIGELGNYYAFKYCCRARGEKMEKEGIRYACLARVVREGGFKVALIIRLSVIPGHFSTAVFSTCGMGVFVFALAAFFSLPKQLVAVFIGVILEQSGTGTTSNTDTIISDVVLVLTVIITIAAGYYIWVLINGVKPAIIYERRKARQVKMANTTYGFDNNSATNLYPSANSEVDLPLSVIPQRPANFAFNQPQRQQSGNYAGSGGYTPTYAQGQYGETLDVDFERKGTEGWELRDARVDDMRGAKWGGAAGGSKTGHITDDEDDSEESIVTVSPSHPSLPPALPPPPPPPPTTQHLQSPPFVASSAMQNPFEVPAQQQQQQQQQQQHPRRAYQLSDPPVVAHSPLPSDSSYIYPPSLYPESGYAQTSVLPPHSQEPTGYSHGPEGSQVGYDSQYLPSGQARYPLDPTGPSY